MQDLDLLGADVIEAGGDAGVHLVLEAKEACRSVGRCAHRRKR
jgi:hypothetical protein